MLNNVGKSGVCNGFSEKKRAVLGLFRGLKKPNGMCEKNVSAVWFALCVDCLRRYYGAVKP